MLDPMQQRLDAYHAHAMRAIVPRFRVGSVTSGVEGFGATDVSVPGSSRTMSGVGISPSSEINSGLVTGWPVLMVDGGNSKPLVLGQSPWQVGGQ